MYVEVWQHFTQVLGNVRGALSPSDKQTCDQVLNWAGQQGGNYYGIDENEKSTVKIWVRGIQSQFTGQSRTDLQNCEGFIGTLNNTIPAQYYYTTYGCTEHGYYWYDAACHADPKPPEPLPTPPKPEPIPIPPIPITPPPPPPPLPLPIPAGLEQLLEQVEAFYDSIPIGQIIKKGIVLLARNWLRAIVSFQQFISGRGK